MKCGFGILRPEVREKSPVIEETEDLIQSILQYIDERVGTETKSVKTFDEIKSLFKKLLQEFEEDDDSLPDKTKVIIEENIIMLASIKTACLRNKSKRAPIQQKIVFLLLL